MNNPRPNIQFASAPVSWGVQDFRDAAWDQPWERVLDEIAAAGYQGTELGPYGFYPVDPAQLQPALQSRKLAMLSAFVPVALSEPALAAQAVDHVRKVGKVLAALKGPLLVLSDAQTPDRQRMAGRVPADGSSSLKPDQWQNVGEVLREIEKVADEFGLAAVFHPHVATHIETPAEVQRLFETLSGTGIGLCLDTGHCVYGGGDPLEEARKYRALLRYVHIKDINAEVLGEARRRRLTFAEAVAQGVFSQIGKGCIYFPAFFRLLREIGYCGWAIVEQDIEYGKSVVRPVESMKAGLDYLKNVLSGAQDAA
ncbi:MAG: TIM barrel protein [Terriglobia bacterium]